MANKYIHVTKLGKSSIHLNPYTSQMGAIVHHQNVNNQSFTGQLLFLLPKWQFQSTGGKIGLTTKN